MARSFVLWLVLATACDCGQPGNDRDAAPETTDGPAPDDGATPTGDECGSLTDSVSLELTTATGSTDHVQSVEVRYVGVWCDPEIRLSLHMGPTDGLPARLDVEAPMPFDLFDREEPFEGPLVLDATYQWEGALERLDGQLTLVHADVVSDGRVVGELSVEQPSLQLTAGFDLQWCVWDTCP